MTGRKVIVEHSVRKMGFRRVRLAITIRRTDGTLVAGRFNGRSERQCWVRFDNWIRYQ